MKRKVLWLSSVLLIVVLATGSKGGLGYFSPDSLEYYTQSEFTTFCGALPIYRSFRRTTQNKVLTYIQAEGFVQPIPNVRDRWDIVFHWSHYWRDGDGGMYKVLRRDADEIIAWCNADRERATIYWTAGFKHLRSDDPSDQSVGEAILRSGWQCESIEELHRWIEMIEQE